MPEGNFEAEKRDLSTGSIPSATPEARCSGTREHHPIGVSRSKKCRAL
jgi:hypothetical protein